MYPVTKTHSGNWTLCLSGYCRVSNCAVTKPELYCSWQRATETFSLLHARTHARTHAHTYIFLVTTCFLNFCIAFTDWLTSQCFFLSTHIPPYGCLLFIMSEWIQYIYIFWSSCQMAVVSASVLSMQRRVDPLCGAICLGDILPHFHAFCC